MKTLAMLSGPLTALDDARRLAGIGISGAYTFEGPNDPFLPLARVAGLVDLELMTNVAIALPRNTMHLAHVANDLQRMSGGRFVLGLGSQVRTHIERRFGVGFDRPVARMRECVAALRAIFACWEEGSSLRFEGEFRHHTLMTPMFNPGPVPGGPPPIHLGAVGPQMTTMAAEVADGLQIMTFSTQRFLEQVTFPAVERGLDRAGRLPTDFELVGQVIVAAASDEAEQAEADAAVRGLLGFYSSTPAYRAVLDAEGWGDLQPELQQLSREGRWDEMGSAIDDTMLERLAVRGSPASVADGIRRRFDGRCERVTLTAPYGIRDDTLAAVVDELG